MAERKLLSNDIERVEDGDTIRVNGKTYRIGGIDAAEVPHDDMDRGAAPGGLVARDIVAHTPQAVRLSNKDGGYGRSLAYFEPTEEGGRTSNEILIAADLAGPSTFEDPPEDVKRAAMQKTYRILHGIDDDEYVKNIRGFVRNVNSATSDYGIAGYNPYESKGYREPNKDKWMQNSLARGADMLQKNLYETASAVSDLVGADGVKEWADRNAKLNDIDITRNPARVKSLSDIHGFGDALIYGTERALEQAPSLAFDLGTAAASGGTGVVLKGAGLATNATKWAKAGAFASSFIQNTGDAYDSMKQAGAQHASGGAILTGLAMGALDFAGLDYMVKGVMRPFGISDDVAEETVKQAVGAKALVNDVLKTSAKTAMFEGSTESLQELVKEGGVTLAGGDTDKLGPLDERLLESFVAGGVVGGAYAGAGRSAKHGIDTLANRKNREENAELANTYHEHDLNAQQIDADGNVTQAPNRYYDPRHEAVEPEQGFTPQETVTEPETVQEPVQTAPNQTVPISEENNSQNIDLQQENQEFKPNQTEHQPQSITIDGAAFRDAVNDMRQQPIEDVVEEPVQESNFVDMSKSDGYNLREIIRKTLRIRKGIPDVVRSVVLNDTLHELERRELPRISSEPNDSIEQRIDTKIRDNPQLHEAIDKAVADRQRQLLNALPNTTDSNERQKIKSELSELDLFIGRRDTFYKRESADFNQVKREAVSTIEKNIRDNYSDQHAQKGDPIGTVIGNLHTAISNKNADAVRSIIDTYAPRMKSNSVMLSKLVTDETNDFNSFAKSYAPNLAPEQVFDKIKSAYLHKEYRHKYARDGFVTEATKEAIDRSFAPTDATHIESVPEHTRPSNKSGEEDVRMEKEVTRAINRLMQGTFNGALESNTDKVGYENLARKNETKNTETLLDEDTANDNIDTAISNNINNEIGDTTQQSALSETEKDQFDVSDSRDLDLIRYAIENGYKQYFRVSPNSSDRRYVKFIDDLHSTLRQQYPTQFSDSKSKAFDDKRNETLNVVKKLENNGNADTDSLRQIRRSIESGYIDYDYVKPSSNDTRYTNLAYETYAALKEHYPNHFPSELKHDKKGRLDHNVFRSTLVKALDSIIDDLDSNKAVEQNAIDSVYQQTIEAGFIVGQLYHSGTVANKAFADIVYKRLKTSDTDIQLLSERFGVNTSDMTRALDTAFNVSFDQARNNLESNKHKISTAESVSLFTKTLSGSPNTDENRAHKLLFEQVFSSLKPVKVNEELLTLARHIIETSGNLSPNELIQRLYGIGFLRRKSDAMDNNTFVDTFGVYKANDRTNGNVVFHLGKTGLTRTVNVLSLIQAEFNSTDVLKDFSERFIEAVHNALGRLNAYKADEMALSEASTFFTKLNDDFPLVVFNDQIYTKKDYTNAREKTLANRPQYDIRKLRKHIDSAFNQLTEHLQRFESFENPLSRTADKNAQHTISRDGFDLAIKEAFYGDEDSISSAKSVLGDLYSEVYTLYIDPLIRNNDYSLSEARADKRVDSNKLKSIVNAMSKVMYQNKDNEGKVIKDSKLAVRIYEELSNVRSLISDIEGFAIKIYESTLGDEKLSDVAENALIVNDGEPRVSIDENEGQTYKNEDEVFTDIFRTTRSKDLAYAGTSISAQPKAKSETMRQVFNEAITAGTDFYIAETTDTGSINVTTIRNGEIVSRQEIKPTDDNGILEYTKNGVVLHAGENTISNGVLHPIDVNHLVTYLRDGELVPSVSDNKLSNIKQAYQSVIGKEFDATNDIALLLYHTAYGVSRTFSGKTTLRGAARIVKTPVRFNFGDQKLPESIEKDIRNNVTTLVRQSGIANEITVDMSENLSNDQIGVETYDNNGAIGYRIRMPQLTDNADRGVWAMKLGHEVGHIILDQYAAAFDVDQLDTETVKGFTKLYRDVLKNPTADNKEYFADSYAQLFVKRLSLYGQGKAENIKNDDKNSESKVASFRDYVVQRFHRVGRAIYDFMHDLINQFANETGRKQVLNSREQEAFIASLDRDTTEMSKYARQMQENLLGEKIKMYPKRRAGLLTSIAGAIVPNYIRLARISKPIAEMFTKQVHLKTILQKRASSREIAGRLYQGSKINEKLVENGYKDLVNGRNTVAANMVKTWIENINKMVKRTLDPNDIGAYDADRINDTKIPYQLDPNKVDRNPARVIAILKQQGIQHAELLVDTALRGVDDNAFGVVAQQSWNTILANDKHRAALADYLDNNGVSVINSYIHNLAHTAGMKVAFGAHEREESDGTLRKYDDGRVRFHARVKLNHFVQGLSPEEADVVGQIYRSLNGDWGPRAPNIVRNSFNALNLISSMGILTYAGLSNIMDTAIPLMKAGKFSIAMKGIYQALRQISASNRDISQLAHSLGVINHSILQNTLSGIFINDRNTLGRALDKTADLYFTLNGMNFTTKISRLVATSIAVESFKHAARNPSDRVNASLLKQLNMTASDVQRVMNFIGDGDINKIFDDNLISDGALANAIENFKNGLVYFVSNSTLDPNAISDPILASNPWFALLTNLKRFFYAFHDMVIRGQFNEIAARSAQMNGLKDLPYVAYPLFAMFMFLMPLSFAAWWLRELFRDGDLEKGNPADLPAWEIAKGTLSRSGVLGLGEIYMNAENAQEYGTPAVLSLTPSVAQTYRVARDIYNEKYEQAAKDGLPFYKVIQNWSKTLSE